MGDGGNSDVKSDFTSVKFDDTNSSGGSSPRIFSNISNSSNTPHTPTTVPPKGLGTIQASQLPALDNASNRVNVMQANANYRVNTSQLTSQEGNEKHIRRDNSTGHMSNIVNELCPSESSKTEYPSNNGKVVEKEPQTRNTTQSQNRSDSYKAKEKTEKRQLTDKEIDSILSEGYFRVHQDLWERIPKGAAVCYFKAKDAAKPKNRQARFRQGYLKDIYQNEKSQGLMISNMSIDKVVTKGRRTYSIRNSKIEELWKKYDESAFIEIHLIMSSLSQKKNQIKSLEDQLRVAAKDHADLEARVAKLQAMVIALVRKSAPPV
jgi:hypothetical protein